MEQVFGSGCSSGCESGWTLYLEHSMYPSSHSLQNPNNNNNNGDGFICKKGTFTCEDYYEVVEVEEEEEDMSMVSDASSGPPHFQEHFQQHFQEQEVECYNMTTTNTNNVGGGGGGGCCVYPPPLPSLVDHHPTNGKKQKIPKQPNLHRKVQDLPSYLDDTASSPFFNFSNNNLTVPGNKGSMADNDDIIDYSQGYSTTYFEGKSTFQDHFGFFHPSVSGSQLQQNHRWFEGQRR